VTDRSDPEEAIPAFFQSTHEAAATLVDWVRDILEGTISGSS
jgi:tRNA/tmRNA/rRNA uracil-C5-methylase (TrmA/RlmC/RlmD family)